jgi:TolB-like protein/Tfp pilus assembly protein PilF
MWIPAAALLVVLAISAIYWIAGRTGSPPKEPAKRPSIAIFPFENLSDDPAQSYFSTGFSKDLLTDLAKFGELVVVEGNSEGAGPEKPVDYAAEGRKMNVRYVLAGSVRKEADRLRVNTRLVSAKNGRHIWTERYDRRLAGVFEVQDDIVEAIARKLAVAIEETERQRVFRKGTQNLDAYDHVLRGWHHFYKRTRVDNREAQAQFSAALELDPQYTEAYVGLADTRVFDVVYGFTEFPRKALQEARQYVDSALAIDPNNAGAHSTKGYIAMRTGAYEVAVEELRRAIDLNPNDWRSYRYLGAVLLYSGQPADALRWYELAMAYAPVTTPGMHMNVGIIHFLEGRYGEAEKWLRRAADRWPAFLGTHIVLAATYATIGSPEAAAKEVAAIRKISPFFNPEIYGSAYRNPVHRAKIVNALEKAGLGL